MSDVSFGTLEQKQQQPITHLKKKLLKHTEKTPNPRNFRKPDSAFLPVLSLRPHYDLRNAFQALLLMEQHLNSGSLELMRNTIPSAPRNWCCLKSSWF